ncbi:MAG: bifunctional precorrin-2 dehydrogenase/sirohydrochlorin ferrochelatase [Bacteroidota bacterium]|jgi:siroheme synthase-like protein
MSSIEAVNPLFPVFLKLEQLHVLLVGGGFVACEKLTALLQNSPRAQVTVVAISVLPEFRLIAQGFDAVVIIERAFEATDLEGKDLVILATGSIQTSAQIRTQARQHGLLVNTADTPDLCDFYLGSVVRKGAVKIAISTNGKSPTVAKRLREIFEEAFPEEINESLNHLQTIRSYLKGDFADKVKQLNQFTRLLSSQKKKSS